jgi:pyruvate/2-oxoglutarate/acetoin dehydrogenase E1 component
VISWGELLPTALAAASQLRTAGISVDVVCPGERSEWDKQVVLATTEKTAKVLIAGNSGLDTEIAGTLVEEHSTSWTHPSADSLRPTSTSSRRRFASSRNTNEG